MQAPTVFGLFYFLLMFAATFLNVAFYHEIFEAFEGRPVSVAAGLKFSSSRVPAIFAWSLCAGLVGVLIRRLEERAGVLGGLIVGLIGAAWSVACVFAIPVIMHSESANPVEILRLSAVTLKKSWGEGLSGYAGLRFGGFLVVFASVILLGVAIGVSGYLGIYWLIGVSVAAWIIWMIVYSYVMAVADHVHRCILYAFSVRGEVPLGYTREMLDASWKSKPA